jgi:hypothetical protein
MENYENFFLLILHQKVKIENQSVTLNHTISLFSMAHPHNKKDKNQPQFYPLNLSHLITAPKV